MSATLDIPAECSVFAVAPAAAGIADGADRGTLAMAEMAAHLEFTIELELRIVTPAAVVLGHRLGGAGADRYVAALRQIARDELEHAFAAADILPLYGSRHGRPASIALDGAVETLKRHELCSASALIVLFLVAESIVSTYLGGALQLPGGTVASDYLRGHARDELGHGRFVRRLIMTILGDPALMASAVRLEDTVRFAEVLGIATRAYGDAFLTVLRDEAEWQQVTSTSIPWPSRQQYADHLSTGLRPVFHDDSTLVAAFDSGIAAA